MGLQFTWIEANLLDFFLADVRNSRGKFDEIKEEFAINPAPIALQLSLNMGLKILLEVFLIASRINQKLKNKQGIHRFLKGFLPKKFGPLAAIGRTI